MRRLAYHIREAKSWPQSAGAVVLAACVWWGAGCAGLPAASDAADGAAVRTEAAPSERLATSGFYHRRATTSGWFIARPDPALERNRSLSSMLRIVPGIEVAGVERRASVFSDRHAGSCPLAVFVDGAYTTVRNVDELLLEEVEAVEVYRGPSEVPLQFDPPAYDRTCGALLIWSRISLDD